MDCECLFHLLDSTLPTYCTPKAIYIFAFYYEFYAWVLLVVSLHFSLLDEFLNLLITPSFRRPSTGWQKHLIPQGKKSRNSWYLIIGGIKIVACTLTQSGFVHYDWSRINPIVQSLQVSGIKSFYFFFLVESNASVIRLKDVWNSRWLEDSEAHHAPSSFTGRSFHWTKKRIY